jgi:hypothetical protein
MLLNRQTGETTIENFDGETLATIVYTIESFTWIESNLPGRTIMGILEEGRKAYWRVGELVILVWAGMEAHRRRNGGSGGQINPAVAVKIIEDGGGLNPVAMTVMDALMRSAALGLNPDRQRPGDEAVPTMADASSSGSSAPVFHPPPVGS